MHAWLMEDINDNTSTKCVSYLVLVQSLHILCNTSTPPDVRITEDFMAFLITHDMSEQFSK